MWSLFYPFANIPPNFSKLSFPIDVRQELTVAYLQDFRA